FHVDPVAHHTRVRTRHIDEHRVVPGGKLVRGQEPVPGAKQIAADHADRHAVWGETDVSTQAVEAWTREVDRDHVAALHAVRDREGFSAGRGAEVDNARS